MKVFIKGVGEVTLNQNQFIAKGGEGSVYAKNRIAYKIYEDAGKMIPVAKIQELSVLDHPSILKPERIILDKKNNPIGFTAKFIKDAHALCQIFTKSFKKRNNIDNDQVLKLIKKLQDLIQFVHSKKILIVDLNELNFLVDTAFKEVYGIDVGSYQTPSFPAKAIMDSIRDRHCGNHFSNETDWFSFGIISFQMLIGIHPYKGKNPKYNSLDERMINNISVFNSETTVPAVCEPFDVIPKGLRQWYLAILEEGKRVPPPFDYELVAQVIIAKVKELVGSDFFNVEKITEFPEDILAFYSSEGNRVVVTQNSIHHNYIKHNFKKEKIKIGFTPKMGRPIAAYLEGGLVKLYDIVGRKEIPFISSGDVIAEVDGRLIIQNRANVLEIQFNEMGTDIHASVKVIGKALDLPEATKVFDGVIIQNLIGRWVASIFPAPGKCFQVGLKELDDYQVVDAKFENNVLVVIGINRKSGKYDRFVFRLSSDFQQYDVRKVEDTVYTGLNFTVTSHGICVFLNEEEKIEVFSSQKDSATVKIMDDKNLKSDIRLYHEGTKVLFTRGKELYRMSMK